MTKDYYKILGVAEFESAENIKTAYRKLARKLHPDVAGDSSDALRRFKEINEAYEILSNKTKKAEYDRARRFYNYAKSEEKTTTKAETNKAQFEQKKESSFKFNNFFSKKNNEKTEPKDEKIVQKGQDIYSDIEISIFEM